MESTQSLFKQFERQKNLQISELFNFQKREREERKRQQQQKLENLGIDNSGINRIFGSG